MSVPILQHALMFLMCLISMYLANQHELVCASFVPWLHRLSWYQVTMLVVLALWCYYGLTRMAVKYISAGFLKLIISFKYLHGTDENTT